MDETTPSEASSGPGPARHPSRPGRIGPYKIFGLLGEGGMGVVYLAQQTEPIERRVALKVIKAGMDTRRVVARFESERQALARMDHPGIARVLDAGATEAGRPFFAMEHVPGLPITEYCDKARLATVDRLRLFVKVCEAVQHAHQKGVIHRDLKPNNILVAQGEGPPRPKIIDFGVAKATDRRLAREAFTTEHGGVVGTPEYMSPEQATGGILDVDTRSDIYSLGVVLYELLTGRLPFQISWDGAPMEDVRRRIREEEPLRPSLAIVRLGDEAGKVARQRRTDPVSLARQLRGDLDWIVMKALEKGPDRRYDSTAALANDIERHLAYEPVIAGPPGAGYRIGKFVRKHRAAVATAALFALGLVAALTTTYRQSVRMGRQRDAATRQGRKAHSRELALQAINRMPTDPELALLLAMEAVEVAPTEEGEDALRRAYLASHTRAVLRGHKGSVHTIDIDAQGRRIVSSSRDGTARVWDLDTGSQRLVLEGHEGWVSQAVFSPDGKRIATSGGDQTVRIWDARTGAQLAIGKGHGGWVRDVHFRPDGGTIVAGDDGGDGHVLDPRTGEEVARLEGRGGAIYIARYSPDGRWIVLAGRGAEALLYDAESHERMRVLDLGGDWAADVAFDPGGTWMAATSSAGAIRVFALDSGERMHQFPGNGPGTLDLEVYPGGTHLGSAGRDRTARIWDLSSGEMTAVLQGHSASVRKVAFSPDGEWIVTGGGDARLGIWVALSGDLIGMSGGHSGQVADMQFTPDGSTLVTASSDGTLRTWDLARARESIFLRRDPRPVYRATFSPDGERIATVSDNSVTRIWDSRTGKILHGILLGTYTGPQVSVEFHPRRNQLLLSGWDGDLLLHEPVPAGAISTLKGHEGMAPSARFDASGERIVSCGEDGTVRIWSVSKEEEIGRLEGHRGPVRTGAFSPDGSLVATGGDDGSVRLWNPETMQPLAVLDGHTDGVRSVRFDGSGARLVSASLDGTARLWSVDTKEAQLVIEARSLGLNGAVFSPDGRHLLTAGRDGSARLWDAASGTAIALLRGHAGEVSSAEFDPQGQRVVTASVDGTVRVVPASIFCPLDEMVRRAKARTTRTLTPEERRLYLHEGQEDPSGAGFTE